MTQREWYWALIEKAGKTYLIGPDRTESEIRSSSKRLNPSKEKILLLPTRDKSRATQIIKLRLRSLENLNHA